MSFGYAVLLPILRFLLGAFVLYDAKKTGVPYPLLIGIGIALLPFASFPLYIFYQYKRLGSSFFDGVVRKFAVLVFGMFVVFSVLGNTDTAEQKLKTDIKEQQKTNVQKKDVSSSSNEMSLAEKKLTSDAIRVIFKNGNAKFSVGEKKSYDYKGGFLNDFKFNGSSRKIKIYYSNTITRNGIVFSFYDLFLLEKGETNLGDYLYISGPYSYLSTYGDKELGWDSVVFVSDGRSYSFTPKSGDLKVTNPKRDKFDEQVYLGDEVEKCYAVLLGKNPTIVFMRGTDVICSVSLEGKVLDDILDVSLLIPDINSLKGKNGKAYLY